MNFDIVFKLTGAGDAFVNCKSIKLYQVNKNKPLLSQSVFVYCFKLI